MSNSNPSPQPLAFDDELVAALHAGKLDRMEAEAIAECDRGESLDSLTDSPVTQTAPENKARDVALKLHEHFKKTGQMNQ